MEDIIDIIVTETTNLIEITSQPTDEIIDVNIIDNREDVTLNVTPTLVEININSLTGNFGILWGEIEGTLSNQTDLNTALSLKADLVDGKVPSSQLPSYVDDVVEVANYAALPVTGEVGKIYITLDTNYIYRWTGSTYVEIKDSSAVWGAITGTLSNQTDLQSALNLKANDNAVVHLAGTETITGAKTFSANLTVGASAFFNNGILLKDGATSSASGHFAISSLSSTTLGFSSSGGRAFDLIMPTSGGAITVPNGSGTLALTSDLHNVVTIGTANGLSLSTQVLSLGLASSSANGALSSTDWTTFNNKQNALGYTAANDSSVVHLSGNESISGVKTFTTQVNSAQLRFSESGGFGNVAGFTQIGGTADYFNVINGTNTKGAQFTYSGGGNVYTLPASSGTLALTSQLSSYLPLSGGTLTGALSGTSATFSGISEVLKINGGGTSTMYQTFNTTGGNYYIGISSSTGAGLLSGVSAYSMAFVTESARDMVFGTNNTARFTIASTGAATFSSSVTGSGLIAKGTGSFNVNNNIRFLRGTGTEMGYIGWSDETVNNSTWLFKSSNGNPIALSADGINQQFILTTAGNAGIGTTSPTVAAGMGLVINGGATSPRIALKNNASGDASTDGFQLVLTTENEAVLENRENASMRFLTNATEAMRITSGGDVCIASTAPISTRRELRIGGNAVGSRISLGLNGTNYSALVTDSGGNVYLANEFNDSAIKLLMINYNNGVYLSQSATSWTSNSDERLKTDLVAIENATEKVASLRSVIGRYKTDDESKRRPFLIAQDVYSVLPEAVDIDKKTGMMGVQYTEVIPLLVASIKELKSKIETLENK